MIRHRSSGLLALPSAARTGRESLRCAAHRATWEQTGFNVEVGQLLTHTNTGNPVFDCRGEASLADLPTSFEAPRWANSDIAEIVSVRPFELNQAHLHDRENFIPLRDAFVLAQSKNE
ncbi:MAG: hypothetical protein HWE26_02615 [Alteromonadaceae bacterium]|nr:hypothetical protein [Alteromonadaceae bacterium]